MPEPIPIHSDAAARLRALDPRESFLVEAPAGSGKTELLIQRFLVLLALVSDPIQVLAITFTNKATAEMRQRILSALSEAAGNRPVPPAESHRLHTRALAIAALDNDRRHGWNLLDQPQQLNIRTIDSLCAEISSRLPLLSRTGVALRPTDQPLALYREAARRTLLDLSHPDPLISGALQTLLLHRDNNLADCIALIAHLLPSRDQWARHIPSGTILDETTLDTTIRSGFESAIRAEIERKLLVPTPHLDPTELEEICRLVHHAESVLAEEGKPSPYGGGLDWSAPPACTAEFLEHWIALARLLLTAEGDWRKPGGITIRNGFRAKSREKAAIADLLETLSSNPALRDALKAVAELPPPRYSDEQWTIARSLFRVLHRSIAHLRVVFSEIGSVDFTELSIAAAQALRDDTAGLSAALGTTIEHLLVDEFQDTSISQRDLLRSLTSGWDGRSQTIFLVGDPKQSIYLFRHAEVALFHSTRDHGLGAIRPVHLTLAANFRSRPALISQLNADFDILFREDTAGIEFTPSTAARNHSPQSQIAWHIPPPLPDGTTLDTEAAAQHEATTLRSQLQSLISYRSPGDPPLKIAVLARNRNHLNRLMAALRSAGVSYTAVEIDKLGDRQPVRDLLSLTRALLHPADRTAWLSVLRAPWCGLSLAALHTLANGDFTNPLPPHLRDATLLELFGTHDHLLPPDDHIRAARTISILSAAVNQRARMPLSTLIERTWYALGGPHCTDPAGLQASSQFLRLLGSLEASAGTLDAFTIQDQIDRLYEETLPPPLNSPATIELLTMHKSKGLEWDIVFLPSLHRTSGSNRDPLLSWIEVAHPSGSAVLLAPITGKGREKDPLNSYIRRLRTAREAAERKRLYYVACTRAREELHIFAAPSRKDDDSFNTVKGSLLEAAWPAVQRHFASHPPLAFAAKPEPAPPSTGIPIPPPSPTAVAHELAAAAPAERSIQTNQRRLPLGWQPSAPSILALPVRPAASTPVAAFSRPEGGLESRLIGVAVHTFLEHAARRNSILSAESAGTFAPPGRIVATLRSLGLSTDAARRAAPRVSQAIHSVLSSPIGAWLLAPHPTRPGLPRSTEVALSGTVAGIQRNLRLDRLFLGGPEPLAPGQSHLWIVDYKTASHNLPASPDARTDFLRQQRTFYEPQMTAYARLLRGTELPGQQPAPLRLALFYPLLNQLDWWPGELPQSN